MSRNAYENTQLGQIDTLGAERQQRASMEEQKRRVESGEFYSGVGTPAAPSLHEVLLQLHDNLSAINARMVDLRAAYYGPTPQAEEKRATKDLSCECLHDLVTYIHEYGNETRSHVSQTIGEVIESLLP
jgi:hypothetical protein